MRRHMQAAALAVVVALGILATWTPGASASKCGAGLTAYKAQANAPSLCGERFLPRTSVGPIGFGGRRYTYSAPSGSVSFISPPSTFNSRTASPRELAEFGIPAEPSRTSPEYPKWRAMIEGGIHFATPPTALPAIRSPRPLSSNALGVNAASETTANWSGYVDYNPGNEFTQESMWYREPVKRPGTTSCEQQGYTSVAAPWGGLGGTKGESTLGQDGTEIGSGLSFGEHQGWWEVLPALPSDEWEREHVAAMITATPEAPFEAATQWTEIYREGRPEHVYLFYEYNAATKQAVSMYGTGAFQGNSADWIVEQTAGNSLADFYPFQIQGFYNFGHPIKADGSRERIDLEGKNGRIDLAPTEIFGEDEFFSRYIWCEPGQRAEQPEKAKHEGVAPKATTEGATEVKEATAGLEGKVDPLGNDTVYDFEYGMAEGNYDQSTRPTNIGSGEAELPATATATELEPGTTYHYRIVARSGGGFTAGVDMTFKTAGSPPPPPPTATTEGSSGIGVHLATVEATVNPNGADTHYYFEYGNRSAIYEHSAPAQPGTDVGSGTTPDHVTAELSGLRAASAFYYRIVAVSSRGTSFGVQDEGVTESAWRPQTVPSVGFDADLEDGSCLSATFCVAVGWQTPAQGPDVPLGEEWNGSSWEAKSMPSPPSAKLIELPSVSCTTKTACTAVGEWGQSPNNYTKTTPFAERWEKEWTLQTPPVPVGAESTELRDVSCPSTKVCIAVGRYTTHQAADDDWRAVVEHWNGASWSVEIPPAPPELEEESGWESLESVSCVSAKSCTAVGTYRRRGDATPLVERWNGTSWSVEAPTLSGRYSLWFNSVTCTSTNACITVGTYTTEVDGTVVPMAARWNGKGWIAEELPNPLEGAELVPIRVSCYSTSCATLGTVSPGGGVRRVSTVDRWNGAAWEVQPFAPEAGAASTEFLGLSCFSSTECDAVGFSERTGGGFFAVIERSNFALE